MPSAAVPDLRRPLSRRPSRRPARATGSANWGRRSSPAGCASRSACCVTDTTFRDAHQSLLATRMRTYDMLRIAPVLRGPAWPGCSRWRCGAGPRSTRRCASSRNRPGSGWRTCASACPNILFQMLLRSASAVGYTNYPDNVVQAFVKESAQAGIDLFRIFDALNGLPNLQLAIEAVRDTGMLCEAAICYTGDILDPKRTKYNLTTTSTWRRSWRSAAPTCWPSRTWPGCASPTRPSCWSGRCGRRSACPIHFHTHDCAGGQVASLLLAAEEGVDIVDCAMAPLAGHDQPAEPERAGRGAALPAARHRAGRRRRCRRRPTTGRRCGRCYAPFETGQLAPQPDVYQNEMPGGQYTNLYQQAQALGLAGPLARGLPDVRRGQPDVRRHHQGDADVARWSATWPCSWSATT